MLIQSGRQVSLLLEWNLDVDTGYWNCIDWYRVRSGMGNRNGGVRYCVCICVCGFLVSVYLYPSIYRLLRFFFFALLPFLFLLLFFLSIFFFFFFGWDRYFLGGTPGGGYKKNENKENTDLQRSENPPSTIPSIL